MFATLAIIASLQISQVPDKEPISTASQDSGVKFLAGVEVGFLMFPSGYGANGLDYYVSVAPKLGLTVGDLFEIRIGAPLNFMVGDTDPVNKSSNIAGLFPGAQWDELSDYGQILESFRLGREGGRAYLRAGPLRRFTLGQGHLVRHYSNRFNAQYIPSGAQTGLRLGPIQLEAFTSDFLGGRLLGGRFAWDLGRTFSKNDKQNDRYVLSVEAVHDFNLAGLPFHYVTSTATTKLEPLTLLGIDFVAKVARTSLLNVTLLGSGGTRFDTQSWGGAFGIGLDFFPKLVDFSIKAEGRKLQGGYRPGFFGPDYELARYSQYGFFANPLSAVRWPDTWSVYAEAKLAFGKFFSVEANAEYFFFQRVDIEGLIEVNVLKQWLYIQLRGVVTGLLQTPRYYGTASIKAKVLPSLYLHGSVGTVFFPQTDGALVRGVFGNIGAGFDFSTL